MTTTEMPDDVRVRRLRRSRSNRVGAGVSGGLGEYFGVDPVLFRVLFATAAFFGGTGILAYLLAWAAIPEEGTERAPIDGWVGELRSRHVPPWLVAVAGGLALWGVAFSWWAPGPIFPVIAVIVVLLIVFGRRDWQGREVAGDAAAAAPDSDAAAASGVGPDATTRVDLAKVTGGEQGPEPMFPAVGRPTWVDEMRAWVDESKSAHRARRLRALPVKLATLGTLVATLAVLGVVDSVTGVQLQTYFWTSLAIVVAGLLVGLALRRTPWSVSALLPLLVAGAVAFAGSHTQLGDGIGQHEWRPTTVPAAQYRLAFGQGVLDLRALPAQTRPRTVDVRLGAGQLRLLVPPGLNVVVHANVHIGVLSTDGDPAASGHTGLGFTRTVDALPGAVGAPITLDVHVSDGQLALVRD